MRKPAAIMNLIAGEIIIHEYFRAKGAEDCCGIIRLAFAFEPAAMTETDPVD